MDEQKEAQFDFESLRNSLVSLQDSIRQEQRKAQRELFRSFMSEVLKIDFNDEAFIELEESYVKELDALANDDVPLSQRIESFVNSDFLYSVLTVKNLSYEREIKSFLKNLRLLLRNTAKESSETDMQFIQSFMERSLHDISSGIQSGKIPDDVPASIVSSLAEPISQWFKRG